MMRTFCNGGGKRPAAQASVHAFGRARYSTSWEPAVLVTMVARGPVDDVLGAVTPTAVMTATGRTPPFAHHLIHNWQVIRATFTRGDQRADESREWIDSCDPPSPRLQSSQNESYGAPSSGPFVESPRALDTIKPATAPSPRRHQLHSKRSNAPEQGLLDADAERRMQQYLAVAHATDPRLKKLPPLSLSPRQPFNRTPRPAAFATVSALRLKSPRDAARVPLPTGAHERRPIGHADLAVIGAFTTSAAASPRRQCMLAQEGEIGVYLARCEMMDAYSATTQRRRRAKAERLEQQRIADELAAAQERAVRAERKRLMSEARQDGERLGLLKAA